MEHEAGRQELKLLLLIGGKSSRMGVRKECLEFPDGRLAFEHALDTLHCAVPSASTIFISLHNESQLEGIKAQMEALHNVDDEHSHIHDHGSEQPCHSQHSFPKLIPIFDAQEKDIGPAAGLLAAHSKYPNAKWLVLGCDYPLLPSSALQQLIREYRSPVTCSVNRSGFAEPLIAIWDSEALDRLEENVQIGRNGLSSLLKEMKGKLIKPPQEQWITGTNTREEWDEAMRSLLP